MTTKQPIGPRRPSSIDTSGLAPVRREPVVDPAVASAVGAASVGAADLVADDDRDDEPTGGGDLPTSVAGVVGAAAAGVGVPVPDQVSIGFDESDDTSAAADLGGGIEARLPSALTRRADQLDAFQREVTAGADDTGPTRGVDQGAIAKGGASGHPGAYTVISTADGEVKGVATTVPVPQSVIDSGSEFITARQFEREMDERADEAYQARLRREAAGAADGDSTGLGSAQSEVLNPDGSQTTTYHGADGDTIITTYTDGSSEVEHPDGRIYHYDSQGNATDPQNVNTTPWNSSDPDGTRTGDPGEIHNADGSTTWVDDDTGDIWTTFADGTTEVDHPDGTTETFHPDGSHTETYPDGSSSTVDKDGNVIEQTPPEDDSSEESEDGSDSAGEESDSEGSEEGEGTDSDSDQGSDTEGEEGGSEEESASRPEGEEVAGADELLAAGRAFGIHPGAASRHGSTGTGGDVDPADPSYESGLEVGVEIVDWKQRLLVDPPDPDVVGGTGHGTIPDSINPDGGVIDPGDDASGGPGEMGPEDDPFGGMQPGVEPEAPDAADADPSIHHIDPSFRMLDDLDIEPVERDSMFGVGDLDS